MKPGHIMSVESGGGFAALAGIQVQSILSAELFAELVGTRVSGGRNDLSIYCHERWTDLADGLAGASESLEVLLVVASRSAEPVSAVTFFFAARDPNRPQAERKCAEGFKNLWTLLATILDYAELAPVTEEEAVNALAGLGVSAVTEIRRRFERLQISHGVGNLLGNRDKAAFASRQPREDDACIAHLFPWTPSDDPWRRLLETLHQEGDAAVMVHLRGLRQAPESCQTEARAGLAAAEVALTSNIAGISQTVLQLQVGELRKEALRRLSILQGSVLAARVFVASQRPPSTALLSTVRSSLDDASIRPSEYGPELTFRGGAQLLPSSAVEILRPLDNPSIDLLFGPREASAILRTPMPTDLELPGLSINRARTARIVGRSGSDCPVGHNIHRGLRLPVAFDSSMRFRHTYIVGQTGTGKSTLLLHMILNDIREGRGVAVLDPHGPLTEQILLHCPESRAQDVIVVDATDIERPIGFNVLRITERDPLQYRLARDLIIDDLYAYLDRTYDMKETGGPIFETHFRGFLALLLGLEPQAGPLIPNLMVFRTLYHNDKLRRSLIRRIRGKDLILEELIEEATSARGEAALANLAPYVTSKFNRFISDLTLRNIICQNSILDIEEIVNKGKVLLFYLGKGRFGDQAAGLLASQIVSRIRSVVMKRGAQADAPPFYLFADEFQLFADERFSELLAEGRKFKLSLTVAHQFVRQIPETVLSAILGNIGTTVAFRIGAPDGEFLQPLFMPTFDQRDLTSLPNFRAYVRSFGLLGPTPFSLEISPPPGGDDALRAERIRRRSREEYGRDRADVEREIEATYLAYRTMSD
ncbi:MAG: type IV secretory system conjugative DNA transfer family protein [Acidobacteriota bacterium]